MLEATVSTVVLGTVPTALGVVMLELEVVLLSVELVVVLEGVVVVVVVVVVVAVVVVGGVMALLHWSLRMAPGTWHEQQMMLITSYFLVVTPESNWSAFTSATPDRFKPPSPCFKLRKKLKTPFSQFHLENVNLQISIRRDILFWLQPSFIWLVKALSRNPTFTVSPRALWACIAGSVPEAISVSNHLNIRSRILRGSSLRNFNSE